MEVGRGAILPAAGLVAVLAACAEQPPAAPPFRLPPLGGLPVCSSAVPEASHGIVILLDGQADCLREGRHPSVGVFANPYDSAFIPDTGSLLAADCDPAEGRVRPPPPELAIAGLPSGACRMDRRDGWIDIVVEGPLPGRGGATPGTGYTAVLHTRGDRLDGDLALFRRLIAAVRPGPDAGPAPPPP